MKFLPALRFCCFECGFYGDLCSSFSDDVPECLSQFFHVFHCRLVCIGDVSGCLCSVVFVAFEDGSRLSAVGVVVVVCFSFGSGQVRH